MFDEKLVKWFIACWDCSLAFNAFNIIFIIVSFDWLNDLTAFDVVFLKIDWKSLENFDKIDVLMKIDSRDVEKEFANF